MHHDAQLTIVVFIFTVLLEVGVKVLEADGEDGD